MIRVRYKLQSTGWSESQPILTGYGHTLAAYNQSTLEWRLTSYDTEATIDQGSAKNMNAIRRLLKKRLISMGANFKDEVRANRV